MVDDDGNPLPVVPITVDKTLTVSGRAADAKVTGDKIKEVKATADSAATGLTNVRNELAQLKLDAVTVDTTLSKEGYAADAKTVGAKLDKKADADALTEGLAKKSDVGHNHDDRYYTEDEVNVKLGKKSDSDHTHDERYYQQDEIDEKLKVKANMIDIHTLAIPIEG